MNQNSLLSCALSYIQEKAEPVGILDVHGQQEFMRPSEQTRSLKTSHSSQRSFRNLSLKAKDLQGSAILPATTSLNPSSVKSSQFRSPQQQQQLPLSSSQSHFRQPQPIQQLTANNFFSSTRSRKYQQQQQSLPKDGISQPSIGSGSTASTNNPANLKNVPSWGGFNDIRLQQIDFFPNNLKAVQQHRLLSMDPMNPYSLEASQQTLKEHFNTTIDTTDSKKKFITRTVLPLKHLSLSSNKRKQQPEAAKHQLEEFTPAQDFMILQSLKANENATNSSITNNNNSMGSQSSFLGSLISAQQLNSNNTSSAFINLTGLMNSLKPSPNEQQQQFLQTAEMAKKNQKTFKIKKSNQQSSTHSKKQDHSSHPYMNQSATIASQSSSSSKHRVKDSTQMMLGATKVPNKDTMSSSSASSSVSSQQGGLYRSTHSNNKGEATTQQQQYSPLISYEEENNQQQAMMMMPLFALNFQKALETRIVLNSIGI